MAENKNKVRLTVRYGTSEFQEEYNVNNKIEKIRSDGARKFGISAGDIVNFEVYLVKSDGGKEQLQVSKKIEEYPAIRDGSVILLQAPVSQYGASCVASNTSNC